MRIIGITGGIGAGKTEILSYIRKHYKCEIYLADQVAHAVKEPGGICYEQLVGLLGRSVLTQDGLIDRAAMASRIFVDRHLLQRVNDIVHPAVQQYLQDRMKQARDNPLVELFFIEAALLVETGYRDIVDELWYIHADESVRRKRLAVNRGYEQDKITQIMDKQLSEEAFRSACDFEIDNSGSLGDSYKQIDRKLEAYTWQD